jgi:prepilin-type N-terminal cleavage/methylation domain-containing protein
MYRAPSTDRRGFTLVEMLVIIAIIATLLGLLLPAVQKARGMASRIKCLSNMRQCGLAAQQIHDEYHRLPPAYGPFQGQLGTLFFHLLPFVEGQDVYEFGPPHGLPDGTPDSFGGKYRVPLYLCPSDPTNGGPTEPLPELKKVTGGSSLWILVPYALSNTAANWAAFNGESGDMRIPESFPGGTSKTILFTERLANPAPCSSSWTANSGNAWCYGGGREQANNIVAWPHYNPWVGSDATTTTPPPPQSNGLPNPDTVFLTQPAIPNDVLKYVASATSCHTGVINVVMADGSGRGVARQYSETNWFQALTPGADFYSWDD